MMLDVTGSMRSSSKIGALKLAATDLVDMLIPVSGASDTTRIAMIPYSSAVNAGKFARDSSNNQSRKCVIERGGAAQYTDISGTVAPVGYQSDVSCPSIKVMPLTSNSKKLKRQINKLSTSGSTAGTSPKH